MSWSTLESQEPNQKEQAKHFHKFLKNAVVDSIIEVQILMHGKIDEEERKRLEDKATCRLHTMGEHGFKGTKCLI